MTESDALQQGLKPLHIGHLKIRWLRFLFPLRMIGIAVHLLLPQLSNLKEYRPDAELLAAQYQSAWPGDFEGLHAL